MSVICLSVCPSVTVSICLSLKELFSHHQDTYSWEQLNYVNTFWSRLFLLGGIHYSFFMRSMNYKEITCSNNFYQNLNKDLWIINLINRRFYYLDLF